MYTGFHSLNFSNPVCLSSQLNYHTSTSLWSECGVSATTETESIRKPRDALAGEPQAFFKLPCWNKSLGVVVLLWHNSHSWRQMCPWAAFSQTDLAAEPHHNVALFEVGLPIKVGCFQVADPILIGGVEQQDICWDDLITPQLHKVSHSDIFPALLHVSMFVPVILKAYHGWWVAIRRQDCWVLGIKKEKIGDGDTLTFF